MLQILLAFLAISIISTAGYGLVEQLSLQQIMSDQRENARRLDVAADAIQARLVSMPGLDGVYAPAPYTTASGWSYMPSGLGGINATVDGIQFQYCPYAPSAGASNDFVRNADGTSYGIQVRSGVVVSSDFGVLPDGIAAYRPVAFIVAAQRGTTSPPKCSAIRERNGRPFVDGGLVKIVSTPVNVSSGVGTIAASTSDLYVKDGGSGSGRLNDPASLDDALLQWARFRPAQMTIHLVGDASASASAWGSFAPQLAASAGRLTIDGGGFSISAPAGQVSTSGVLSLISVSVAGPTFVVGEGKVMNTRGDVSLQPGLGGSGLFVMSGGRLNIASGTLLVGGAAEGGVEVSGDVVISEGTVAAAGRPWSLGIGQGGRLWASGATIGNTGGRNTQAGLVVSGTTSVVSDASSRVVASSAGSCWQSTSASDVTFSPSTNSDGQGSTSAVFADEPDPGLAVADPSDPGYTAAVAAYQAYRRRVDERQRARQTNHSSFQCI